MITDSCSLSTYISYFLFCFRNISLLIVYLDRNPIQKYSNYQIHFSLIHKHSESDSQTITKGGKDNTMKTFRTLLALLLMFAAILSLGAVAFAEDVKTETKTYKDKNGETVIEVYDEDGELIHKEEPYYKDEKKTGTLCYDSVIWCSWGKGTYTTSAAITLPVMEPEIELDRCLSFTLNMAYFQASKDHLGKQRLYGSFKSAGYLNLDELEEFDKKDFEYSKPKKVDGFAIQPYKYISTTRFSLACALTDVYYLK